jgi:hypothetical protein
LSEKPTTTEAAFTDAYGKLPPSRLTRALAWCAGGDAKLLEHCQYSDHAKFQGLGGVVLATGVLAALSGGYAFYVVFGAKVTTALENQPVDNAGLLTAIVFGALWGAMIFNLDRFVVSSGGKGDGTESVTFGELMHSLPRLGMAVLIGLCLSQPLEVRIFDTEIRAKLAQDQRSQKAELDQKSLAEHDRRKAEKDRARQKVEKDIDAANAQKNQRLLDADAAVAAKGALADEAEAKLAAEVQGRVGSGKAGEGPAAQRLTEQRDRLLKDRLELERQRDAEQQRLAAGVAALHAEAAAISRDTEALNKALVADRDENLKHVVLGDGLIERIRIAHTNYPSESLAITLLLIAIEIAPILFKMFLTKGAYDYLEERQKAIVRAKHGVYTDYITEPAQRVGVLTRMSRWIFGGGPVDRPASSVSPDAEFWQLRLVERHLAAERLEKAARLELASQIKYMEHAHLKYTERRVAELNMRSAPDTAE